MTDAAKKVAESVMIGALVRMMLLLGTPTMIGMLAWFAGNFIAMKEFAAVQAAEQARLVSEVRDLQEYRRDAFARGRAVQQDLITIKEMLSRLQNYNERPPRN